MPESLAPNSRNDGYFKKMREKISTHTTGVPDASVNEMLAAIDKKYGLPPEPVKPAKLEKKEGTPPVLTRLERAIQKFESRFPVSRNYREQELLFIARKILHDIYLFENQEKDNIELLSRKCTKGEGEKLRNLLIQLDDFKLKLLDVIVRSGEELPGD